jgi:hypothetical protein
MATNKQPRYTPQFHTVELRLGGLVLAHSFGTLPEAMAAVETMRRELVGKNAHIWLWHRHAVAGTFSPHIAPGPRALPPPGPDGVRRAPGIGANAQQFFFHASPEKIGL